MHCKQAMSRPIWRYNLNFKINEMKKNGLITIMITLMIMVFWACEEAELPSDTAIEGTYVGTVTNIDSVLNDRTYAKMEESAIAEIIKIGNEMIQVHLYNDEMDTTFMLNYYEDMYNINVCLTGDEFENMYGHMLGLGHTNGGMMNHMQNGETEWMHHLNDEHQESDEHFGGFDMLNHTFRYRFNLLDGGISKEFQFEGQKE